MTANVPLSEEEKTAVANYVADQEPIDIKISVIGAHGNAHGSGSLARLTRRAFPQQIKANLDGGYEMTVQVAEHPVTVDLKMCIGKTYIASSTILEPYLRGTDGFLLVYDVTNRDSFEFLRTAHTKAFGYRETGKPVWVYGARTDRPQMERMVSVEEGEEFCQNIHAKFLRVPAFTAQVLGQAVIEEMTGRAIVSKMSREAASVARREKLSKDLSSADPTPRQRGFSISSLKDKLLNRK